MAKRKAAKRKATKRAMPKPKPVTVPVEDGEGGANLAKPVEIENHGFQAIGDKFGRIQGESKRRQF